MLRPPPSPPRRGRGPRGAGTRALAALLAATLALGSPVSAQVRLPALGESASEDLSVGTERRVGDQILREVRRDPDFLDDPVLLAYVQSLWQPLLAAGRDTGNIDAELERAFAWEVFLVRDRSVNAFAWPGGYVGVHLGLIAITTNRDQLASVLAHELSHVTQRHIARGIAASQRASLMGIAGLLLGVLAASRSNNADVANAAIAGSQAASAQLQLNYSRDMEREADRVGFGLLADAGYAAGGMAQMFERMDYAQRINDTGGFPYLRSHPLTLDRISEARNRVLLAGNTTPPPDALHALMQARARVLMDGNPQALARLATGQSASADATERVAALYGGSLAQAALGQAARSEALAADALRAAASLSPRDPAVERTLTLQQAQARLARGDAPGALKLLDALADAGGDPGGPRVGAGGASAGSSRGAGAAAGAASGAAAAPTAPTAATAGTDTPITSTGPGGARRPLLLMRARAALAWGQRDPAAAADELRRSTEALQTWVAEHGQDAQAWELLAGTAEAAGQKLRAMRAGAEARAVLGDLNGAIDRLRVAQAAARGASAGQDFIEASVIDSRLRQLERERRQLAIEMRQ